MIPGATVEIATLSAVWVELPFVTVTCAMPVAADAGVKNTSCVGETETRGALSVAPLPSVIVTEVPAIEAGYGGACVAVVNPDGSARAFPYSGYRRTLLLRGGGVLDGGTASIAAVMPPGTVPPLSAVIAFQ